MRADIQNKTTLFKKPCLRCYKDFRPTGKFQKICIGCNSKKSKETLTQQYFKNKEQLDIIKDSQTLENWRILSKSYKLGKRIWGSRFTRQRLAFDMEMPMTTVLRCLALDRASKRTWSLIKQKKVTVFKVAQVCQSKSITYQDEIVDLIIKENLSTYQIKSLRINNLKDVSKERHRLAIEKGYSHKYSAASSFQTWISRGKLFLVLGEKALTKNKYEEIKAELKDLNERIDMFLK